MCHHKVREDVAQHVCTCVRGATARPMKLQIGCRPVRLLHVLVVAFVGLHNPAYAISDAIQTLRLYSQLVQSNFLNFHNLTSLPRPIKNNILDSVLSYLIVHLIQKIHIKINYFIMAYFIIKFTLIIIYLFYNLQKINKTNGQICY